MKSYLIKDTTREEREEIVRSSCGNNCGACDGCAAGLGEDMYKDYVEGIAEIAEINARFRARYEKGDEAADIGAYSRSCPES